jgi:asparagine synthase (glutamine-hydrolysing)
MCGIVGIASFTAQHSRTWLNIARDALVHRGPDYAGNWWSECGRIGLAHRRLAIVDTSPEGNQPMHLPYMGLSVVFNGEIYNFRELRAQLKSYGHTFSTSSDTEVLLAAYAQWGTGCLEYFNGMFAFALYDAARQQVFMARDRAGEKPLYYITEQDSLYFASELKALLTYDVLPRRVNLEALDCYLAVGYVPYDRCLLQGYKKLPPAHALCLNLETRTQTIWRYWFPPDYQEETGQPDEAALVDELENLLADAVGKQMLADVPVGILLSGGIDSSLVTAMAARNSSQVRTFSIGFPGNERHDETQHARLIAKHFGTKHTELFAEDATADLIHRLVYQFDEPLVDSSMVPTWLVCSLVREHCTVALGGDGGDELFGGYNHYRRLLWMYHNLKWIPETIRNGVALVAEQALPIGIKGRNYLLALGKLSNAGLPQIATYFDPTARCKLYNGRIAMPIVAEKVMSARVGRVTDTLQRATRMDFETYLPEDILVKVDRTSMANSLEVRAPFLDKRIVEFAFRNVPSVLKATARSQKVLLKSLAARSLPPEFQRNRKQGFSIPLGKWLERGRFRELFWDTLSGECGIFNAGAVAELLSGQDKGRNNGERLFALVQFELWRKAYRVSLT